jgi:spore germination cell wall hydrolase CwlJ-like protein
MIAESALICLALNIYHESRGEPVRGQLAVALVTLNRAQRRQERVCEVVFAPRQFSWTNGATLPPIRDKKAFQRSLGIARAAMKIPDFTQGADHYHHEDVYPKWRTNLVVVEQIGLHIFYKRPQYVTTKTQ